MPTTQELREKRANIWAQAQEFNNRAGNGDAMSAEDEAAWSRALDEVDALGTEIENRERTETLDKRFAEIDEQKRELIPAGSPQARQAEQYRETFERFCRWGMEDLSVDEKQMLRSNFQQLADGQQRAQGAGTGSAGGYTVPEGFWAKVTETMKYYGGAVDGADALTTDSGNPLPWPTNDDTSNVGYILGENTQTSNEGDLTFGQKNLGAYTFVSGPVLASFALIQDSGIDIEGFIARKMGERIGRIQNLRMTTGTGGSQPQGFITGATTGKTAASATAITVDELIDLEHSVDAAYRATGRCVWKLHDLVLAAIRKLKDQNDQYLWQPSVQAGEPSTLLGRRYVVNNDMASTIAASAKTVWFGDPQAAFAVRRVSGATMMRLTERYADYLQVGFIGYERADSLVQDSGAGKLLVQAAS